MFIYKEFIQEYLGKKKDSWTFTEVNQVKHGRTYKHIVTCICDCGTIRYYTACECASYKFPKSCVRCFRKKAKKTYHIQDKVTQREMSEVSSFDIIADDVVTVEIYKEQYKKHYRD